MRCIVEIFYMQYEVCVSKKNIGRRKKFFLKENACLSITIVLSKSEKAKWNSYQE